MTWHFAFGIFSIVIQGIAIVSFLRHSGERKPNYFAASLLGGLILIWLFILATGNR
jgi:hypothetical protein